MTHIIFFIIALALPHTQLIPTKLHLTAEDIPFGVLNWIFVTALIIILIGKSRHINHDNYIRGYAPFVGITLFCAIIGSVSNYEVSTVIPIIKNQTLLLLLYYIPLTSLFDKTDFSKAYYILLFVHFLVALEVLKSGVLGGTNFHDGKRGSGPFSLGFEGSDVAASYLAQVLMYFIAVFLVNTVDIKYKVVCIFSSIIVMFGIFATYSRGALVAAIIGIISMFLFLGLRPKYLLILLIIGFVSFQLAPESIFTRIEQTTSQSGQFDESTQGRFVYWNAAIEIVKENPLGVGTGQVRAAMQRKIGKYVDPHNGFLYTICEYGFIGFLVFCFFIFNVYKNARFVWLDTSNPLIYRVYALGTGGMVGSFVVCNMFYANFYKDLVMGTIVIHFGLMAFIISSIKKNTEGNTI